MRMHFVGGFLGSGKTTAIAGACRILIARGEKVGVVTNDQGKLQVDSLFMRAAGLPTVEVGGGCFCCRYDDFDERVSSLVERERPDTVFAESVGSCADIVATVVKPFEAFRGRYGGRSTFTVLADSRLLLARLSGRRLPFSEEVLYVFDRQLEEAGLVVLNKRDLLSTEEAATLRELAAEAWPDARLIEISGSTEAGAAAWLESLSDAAAEKGVDEAPRASLDIDYGRYGEGERELAWLDERLVVEDRAGLASDGGRCRAAVLAFVLGLGRALAETGIAVGHVKLQVSAPGLEAKLSLTAGDFLAAADAPFDGLRGLEVLVGEQLPRFSARRVLVSLNARVQASPERLAELAAGAAEAARRSCAVAIEEQDRSAFRPGLPRPTHRMA